MRESLFRESRCEKNATHMGDHTNRPEVQVQSQRKQMTSLTEYGQLGIYLRREGLNRRRECKGDSTLYCDLKPSPNASRVKNATDGDLCGRFLSDSTIVSVPVDATLANLGDSVTFRDPNESNASRDCHSKSSTIVFLAQVGTCWRHHQMVRRDPQAS